MRYILFVAFILTLSLSFIILNPSSKSNYIEPVSHSDSLDIDKLLDEELKSIEIDSFPIEEDNYDLLEEEEIDSDSLLF